MIQEEERRHAFSLSRKYLKYAMKRKSGEHAVEFLYQILTICEDRAWNFEFPDHHICRINSIIQRLKLNKTRFYFRASNERHLPRVLRGRCSDGKDSSRLALPTKCIFARASR